jgi:DNA-binding response OmpR family regulator
MKPTLLIAEGDSDLRDIYRRFLAERGYDVQTAVDGLDCLDKMRRRMPAVLVLDRELLWGGAEGVLAWLREQDGTAAVPVVLTATAGCPQASAGQLRLPVVNCLAKPFTLAALAESVRTAGAGSSREEPVYADGRAAGPALNLG